MSENFAAGQKAIPEAHSVRLLAIGPMPPPLHGQTLVMDHMVSQLAPVFPGMRTLAEVNTKRWLRPVVAIRQAFSIRDCDVVYIAVKASQGMWITTGLALLARSVGARVFLHHHSYLYVRERKKRMVALTRAAGPSAYHIVLSHSMASELTSTMPEITRTLVVGNAAMIEQSLADLPLKNDAAELVLGHMSDLSDAKGIGEVVDLAVKLKEAGIRTRLILGGAAPRGEDRRHLDRAERELGEQFDYRGILAGESKIDFYRDINHFVLPSRDEAVPLVLYEALAAGAVCVATRVGSVPEQLERSPAVLAQSADTFVEEVLPILSSWSVTEETSRGCRQAYLDALSESQEQLQLLVRLLAGNSDGRPRGS